MSKITLHFERDDVISFLQDLDRQRTLHCQTPEQRTDFEKDWGGAVNPTARFLIFATLDAALSQNQIEKYEVTTRDRLERILPKLVLAENNRSEIVANHVAGRQSYAKIQALVQENPSLIEQLNSRISDLNLSAGIEKSRFCIFHRDGDMVVLNDMTEDEETRLLEEIQIVLSDN